MTGTPPSWIAPLLAAFRTGRLSAHELWGVVLDCHELADPGPVVAHLLRAVAPEAAPAPVRPTASPRRRMAVGEEDEVVVLEDEPLPAA